MNTIKIHAYKYQDLSEKAKEKVKYWFDEDTDLFPQWEREYWSEELAKLGYEDCDFQYCISYSQGDGASIACSVNVQQFIKRHKLGKKYASLMYWLRRNMKDFHTDSSIHIKRSLWPNYVHDGMLYADTESIFDDLTYYSAPGKAIDQVAEIANMILAEVQEQSRKLYKQLLAEHEYHFTDEYMIDVCDANEYLFDEYGDPVHHLEVA